MGFFLIARLLRCQTIPYLRQHRARTLLTAVGIGLGAATVVAIADVSASMLESFRDMVSTLAGDSELEISAPVGVDEALIDQVGRVPGVHAAAGTIERFLPLADRPDDMVLLLGLDFLG